MVKTHNEKLYSNLLRILANPTTGANPEYCQTLGTKRDNSAFMELLRIHADVYPTGKADVQFTFPVESAEEEELRLNFNW